MNQLMRHSGRSSYGHRKRSEPPTSARNQRRLAAKAERKRQTEQAKE